MSTPLLDISFLYDLADNDNVYIYEVIKLFLDNVPAGIQRLEKAIKETDDYETIRKQSHALKSSAGIVKIREMYNDLAAIEALARQQTGKEEMQIILERMLVNFNLALPLIQAERDKNSPSKK